MARRKVFYPIVCLFLFGALMLPSHGFAQEAGSICKLGDTTKLFIAKDGKKYLAKLAKGTEVVLKHDHGTRWMVKTVAGKLGFIKSSWLTQTCKFTKPAPEPKPESKPEPVAPVAENVPDAV